MNKEDVKQWLDEQKIIDYVIHDNLVVDVNGSVELHGGIFTEIPIQFGTVHGHFHCSYNQLTCLYGCPQSVLGDFIVFNNNLNSLEGIPKHITGDCFLQHNPLISLNKIGNTVIEGNLFLNNTNIISLNLSQLPSFVGGKIFLSNDYSPIEYFEFLTKTKKNKKNIISYELITSLDEIKAVFNRLYEHNEIKKLHVNNTHKNPTKQKI